MIRAILARLGPRGVTLLEAVFTIIIAAILTAIMTNLFGDALKRSTDPIVRLKKTYYLSQVMEAVLNDYNDQLETASSPLAALVTIKNNIAADKYGTYTVVFNDFIEFNAPSGHGPETIIEKSTIPSEDDVLKVTLQNDTGETLTALFTALED